MKKVLLATTFSVSLFVLAACSGDNTGQSDGTNSSEEYSSTSQIDITSSNFEFDQAEYTVSAGEEVTITLTNEEGMHGVGIDEFGVNIKGDGETTFTPDETGEYTIYCSVPCGQGHADMKSTLIVQ